MQRSPAYRLFTQWSTRIAYLRGVAAALDHMHSHSRVHRDLTSTNLLVTEDWQAKVTSPLPPPPHPTTTSHHHLRLPACSISFLGPTPLCWFQKAYIPPPPTPPLISMTSDALSFLCI